MEKRHAVVPVSPGPAWLFVPGNRPDRFAKAAASGADQVILDLEDAVVPADKNQARSAVAQWLASGGSGWVRVNESASSWFKADIQAVNGLPGLAGLILSKAESTNDLRQVKALSGGAKVMALVETARGVRRAFDLAECGHADLMAFGSIDFAADLGCDDTDDALALARATLLLASPSAGLAPPLDGISSSIKDLGSVAAAASRARSMGFGGKLVIHPAQVPVVQESFRPTPEQVSWALRVQDAAGTGASTVDGEMVDRPVLVRANDILRRYGRPT